MKRKQTGNITNCFESNKENALDFAGLFQNAINAHKWLLVSVDHYSCWSEAKFLRKPNTEKVLEFLRNYIARHGIPQVLRTDSATFFRSKQFKQFCQKRLIQNIECPVGNHRGNGKIKRLIRTINELLRTNKQ